MKNEGSENLQDNWSGFRSTIRRLRRFSQITMRDERTFKIIGCAMEVHRELGCGFLEGVYQEALDREFTIQEIPFKAQPLIQIKYKGQSLNKTYQPDFTCYDEIIVEIKALSADTKLN